MVSKRISFLLIAVVATISVAHPLHVLAQTASSSAGNGSSNAAQWSVQVAMVDAGDVNLAPSFQIAIYESLLEELTKSKRFQQVFRDGDRSAVGKPNLLVLKTTVQKYTPGSETKRAVTTVGGATKLTVQSQLLTRDGRVVLERTVNGNVRFVGSNMRATHNLARNVAKTIKHSALPEPAISVAAQSGNTQH
jgi:hypothetical protein